MLTILSQADAAAATIKVGASARVLEGEIHQIAYSVLDHAREHGNCSGARDLANALPRGIRREGIAAWLRHFSGKQVSLRLDPKTKLFVGEMAEKWDAAKFLVVDETTPTYAEFTQEVAPSTMTLDKLIKKLSSISVNAGVNDDEAKSPKVTREAREAAQLMLASFAGRAKTA